MKDFCTTCRKETEYEFVQSPISHTINDKEYSFIITEAICKECHGGMDVPGILERNAHEIEEQYRQYKQI